MCDWHTFIFMRHPYSFIWLHSFSFIWRQIICIYVSVIFMWHPYSFIWLHLCSFIWRHLYLCVFDTHSYSCGIHIHSFDCIRVHSYGVSHIYVSVIVMCHWYTFKFMRLPYSFIWLRSFSFIWRQIICIYVSVIFMWHPYSFIWLHSCHMTHKYNLIAFIFIHMTSFVFMCQSHLCVCWHTFILMWLPYSFIWLHLFSFTWRHSYLCVSHIYVHIYMCVEWRVPSNEWILVIPHTYMSLTHIHIHVTSIFIHLIAFMCIYVCGMMRSSAYNWNKYPPPLIGIRLPRDFHIHSFDCIYVHIYVWNDEV